MTTVQFLAEWAVRSSALIAGATLLLWALRVRDPSIRWAAWTAVLCASLAIPALTPALPELPLVVLRAVPAPVAALLETPALVHEPATEPEREAARPNLPATTPNTPESKGFDGARTVPRPNIQVKPRVITVPRTFYWWRVVVTVYVLAALALLFRVGFGLVMSQRLLRSSRPTGEVAEGIEINVSEGVATPVVLGIFRPKIVLPADWRKWDEIRFEAVLAHERAHIRRHDPAVQLLSAIHRALLWYSPLSWFLHRRIVRTAEEASDDAALAVTRNRALYADILLDFIRSGVRSPTWQAVPMARYGRAEKRIHRILDGTLLSRGVTRRGLAAILAAGLPLAYLVAAAHPVNAPPAPTSKGKLRPILASSAATNVASGNSVVTLLPSADYQPWTWNVQRGQMVPDSSVEGGLKPMNLAVPPLSGAPAGSYVVLIVNINPNGNVTSTRVLSDDHGLSPQVMAAAKGWRFSPPTVKGTPVSTAIPAKVTLMARATPPPAPPAEPGTEYTPENPKPSAPAVDPKEAREKLTLGRFHLQRGEYDAAIAAFRQGLRLDPADRLLQESLQESLTQAISACRNEHAELGGQSDCGEPESLGPTQIGAQTGQFAQLEIISKPPGVEVVIDGKSYGPSPIRAVLAPGYHTYSIKFPGVPPSERSIVLQSGQVVTKNISFGSMLTGPQTVSPAVGPREVEGKRLVGEFHLKRGEYDEAIRCFSEGLEIDPADAELRQELDRAIKSCQKENQLLSEGLKCGVPEPADPAVDLRKEVIGKLTVGKFHRDRGEYDLAIESFREGLKLDPGNLELNQNLAKAIKACQKENQFLNTGLKCGAPESPAPMPSEAEQRVPKIGDQLAKPGELDIITDPPGAEVLIDGESQGNSPVHAVVAPGYHTYAVKLPGMPVVEKPFSIQSGEVVTRKVGLGTIAATGMVEVRTIPPGATVMDGANGSPVGGQTPTAFRLPVGAHTLVISIPGYEPVQQQVEVSEGWTSTVNVKLTNR